MDRVAGVDFRLRVRHVILRAFLIRLEAEISVPKRREECFADCFSILNRHVLTGNNTGCRMVGHEPGRPFCLFAPETAVNREEPERHRGFLPDGTECHEPAARHVAAEGGAR